MKIGYIRVSRDKQTTALQEDAMQKEHCARVFTDKMSGSPPLLVNSRPLGYETLARACYPKKYTSSGCCFFTYKEDSADGSGTVAGMVC